jgi:hypothetical protein
MLEYLSAKHAIERVVGKVELRYISGDGDHARVDKRWLLQIEGSHVGEILSEELGKMSVSCADI